MTHTNPQVSKNNAGNSPKTQGNGIVYTDKLRGKQAFLNELGFQLSRVNQLISPEASDRHLNIYVKRKQNLIAAWNKLIEAKNGRVPRR